FFSSRRRHTRSKRDWSSDVCSSDLQQLFARTVREDVSFGPRALGYGEREVARRASDALEALALTAHATQHPYDLPPALRTLAALAGALALEPAVLVLDEPTVGLDRALRAQ